jgi:hypothetical protein
VKKIEASQPITVLPPTPAYQPALEHFVGPQEAADFLRTSKKHVLNMVRRRLIPGHPLDPTAQKKDWRFLLSELRAYMLTCGQRPPEAPKPRRV